jgi:CHAT domain-containing protein
MPRSFAGGLALVSAGAVVFETDGAPSAENQRLAYAAFQKASTIGEGSKNATVTSLVTGENRDALALGLSKAVAGYASLPNVKKEVAEIQEINGGKTLLDEQFSRVRFEGELKGSPYNVVHIASHGEFGSDPSKTFVLTYDGKLTMDDLERTIKYGELRESALELLTLDACQTASGDDPAALGLAGIALKSGARSALATLWFISDKASGELVVHFYQALRARTVSKSQALQAAQRDLLADPRFAHPAYWAPFLLIGNWLYNWL